MPHSKKLSSAQWWILIMVSVSAAVPVYKSGTVTLLVILGLLNIPIMEVRYLKRIPLKWFICASLFWSMSQISRDLYVGVPLFSAFVAAGGVISIYVTFLCYLCQKYLISWSYMLLSAAIGNLFLEFSVGYAFQTNNNWKYSYGILIVLVLFTIISIQNYSVFVNTLLVTALSSISFYFDSRSLFIFSVISGIYLVFPKNHRARKNPRGFLWMIFVISLSLSFAFIPSVGTPTFFNQRSGEILSGNPTALAATLAARIEAPQLLYLAIHNFPLGIGSYGNVSAKQSENSVNFVNTHIKDLNTNELKYLRFNSQSGINYTVHSQLGTSLLFGGISAIPFWFFIFKRMKISSRKILATRRNQFLPVVFLNIITFWNALFSPYTTRSYALIALVIFANLNPIFKVNKEEGYDRHA